MSNVQQLTKQSRASRVFMLMTRPDGLGDFFQIERRTVLVCCYLLLCIYACLNVGGSFCQFVLSKAIATQPGSQRQEIPQLIERIVSLSCLVVIGALTNSCDWFYFTTVVLWSEVHVAVWRRCGLGTFSTA
jgi:hypothetical protein